MGASVKIMLSYDYCHFEVSKSTDEAVTDKEINEMRKDVQRLADEAVRQYKVAKRKAGERPTYDEREFIKAVANINMKPEGERTPEEKAMLKQYEDEEWENRFASYDYDDEDQPY